MKVLTLKKLTVLTLKNILGKGSPRPKAVWSVFIENDLLQNFLKILAQVPPTENFFYFLQFHNCLFF